VQTPEALERPMVKHLGIGSTSGAMLTRSERVGTRSRQSHRSGSIGVIFGIGSITVVLPGDDVHPGFLAATPEEMMLIHRSIRQPLLGPMGHWWIHCTNPHSSCNTAQVEPMP